MQNIQTIYLSKCDLSNSLQEPPYKDIDLAELTDFSDYTNLTGSRIYINDSDPNYNWNKTTAENDWISGSGTWRDPYIIKNVYIEGKYLSVCIWIFHSTAHFIIKNCYFTSSEGWKWSIAISLINTSNGYIFNNSISYFGIGVFLDSCKNITIEYNTLLNDFNTDYTYFPYASDVYNSNNCSFIRNKIYGYLKGIDLEGTEDIKIKENVVVNPFPYYDIYGVELRYSHFCKIVGNIFKGNKTNSRTIFEVEEISAYNNTILNNIIIGSEPNVNFTVPKISGGYEYLVKLYYSNYNIIKDNIFYVPGYRAPIKIYGYDLLSLIIIITLPSIFLMHKSRSLEGKKPKNH